ncbi:MAG TPA: acyl carrier protein [Candidatus Binatia bacterium]|nr:acyl carrier protein [Candidatus Binatia bacterium]
MAGAEARIRRVVAEQLGLSAQELTLDVSLTDDLAADSLDLAELAISLEDEFDVGLAESALDHVRTYGDLVQTVLDAVRARHIDASPWEPMLVRARVVPPGVTGDAALLHAGPLTPYLIESIAEDARRAGEGAALEVTVPPATTDADLGRLTRQLGPLADRGVHVSVRRDGHRPAGTRPADARS